MKKLLALTLISALFLAACSKTEDVDTDDSAMTDDTAAVDQVPFSEVGMSMLSASKASRDDLKGYPEFPFLQGTGDCVDKGFPSEFSYIFDDTLGYKIVASSDGSFRDDYIGLGANGLLNLIDVGFTLEGVEGEPTCSARTTTGEDDATFECRVEDEVVCTASYKVFAIGQ